MNRIQGFKGSSRGVLPYVSTILNPRILEPSNPSTTTIFKILKDVEEEFKSEGIQNPRLEAETLLLEAIRLDRVGLYTNYDRILTDEEIERFLKMLERRLKREPIQYILGNCEFWGLEFMVTPDVLIPRPETELLVEEVLRLFTIHSSRLTILDLCTGSGCIAIALAKELIDAEIYAIDKSIGALKVARENAKRHKVEERIRFIEGDLFEPFAPSPGSSPLGGEGCVREFDLIISNPPYIPSHEIDLLEPEVRYYEPREAIDGGPDGLGFYRRILEGVNEDLKSGGWLMLEVGEGQVEEVIDFISKTDKFMNPDIIKDLAGHDRIVRVRKP